MWMSRVAKTHIGSIRPLQKRDQHHGPQEIRIALTFACDEAQDCKTLKRSKASRSKCKSWPRFEAIATFPNAGTTVEKLPELIEAGLPDVAAISLSNVGLVFGYRQFPAGVEFLIDLVRKKRL